ncbi:Adenosine deaminase-like protein [Serendipita indica DSM 11827]|nr:Adenosine deaminase-like protein [Serendipita indica DSM 11827]
MHDFGGEALASLSTEDVDFIKALPKAELHAHLNGCIPLECLQELVNQHPEITSGSDGAVAKGLKILEQGVVLNEINEFFDLFPAIYAITSTPDALKKATRATIAQFLEPGSLGAGEPAQCTYLELRTTPRESSFMSKREYLETVLDEVEKYDKDKCNLIISLDRRMSPGIMMENVKLAISLREAGRRVVGVDLCGTPMAGKADDFLAAFEYARENGLKLTLHIAETKENTEEDTMTLLSAKPARLGHATFLHEESLSVVLNHKETMAVEICLSSNLLCKTVETIAEHHISWWLSNGLPIAICTDDTLVFRNSLVEEYALLLAAPPLGLGLPRETVAQMARMSLQVGFHQ